MVKLLSFETWQYVEIQSIEIEWLLCKLFGFNIATFTLRLHYVALWRHNNVNYAYVWLKEGLFGIESCMCTTYLVADAADEDLWHATVCPLLKLILPGYLVLMYIATMQGTR